jgi:hypothetical protein
MSKLRSLVAAVLVGAFLAATLSGCVETGKPSATGSLSVSAGSPASLQTSGVTVVLNAKSLSGSGTLSVTPTRSTSGVSGVAIRLSGAKLVGTAKLTFPHVLMKGEPAPLVGYTESTGAPITLVGGVKLSAVGASVVTTHFSNWFTDWWGSIFQGARDLLDKAYSSDAAADKPTCSGEAAVRKAGVTVSSSSGAQIEWCLGQDGAGNPELKLVNARGYTASTEQTRGLTLTNPDTIFGDLLPALFSFLAPAPSVAGDKTQLLGPGDEYTYSLTGYGTQGVQVLPSGAASLASSLVFGAETLELMAPFLPKGTPKTTINILKALSGVQCLADFQGMATATVTNASQAVSYLDKAIPGVFGCLADVLEKQFGLDGVVAGILIAGFSWIEDGVKDVLNDLAGAADSALNPNGYQILVKRTTPANTPTVTSSWVIDQTGIGPYKFGMTPSQVPNDLPSSLRQNFDTGGSGCMVTFNPSGNNWDLYLDSNPASSADPVDVRFMWLDTDSAPTAPADTPHTANGLTLGSTFSAVLAANPGSRVVKVSVLGDYITVILPGGTPLVFSDLGNNGSTKVANVVEAIYVNLPTPPLEYCG